MPLSMSISSCIPQHPNDVVVLVRILTISWCMHSALTFSLKGIGMVVQLSVQLICTYSRGPHTHPVLCLAKYFLWISFSCMLTLFCALVRRQIIGLAWPTVIILHSCFSWTHTYFDKDFFYAINWHFLSPISFWFPACNYWYLCALENPILVK